MTYRVALAGIYAVNIIGASALFYLGLKWVAWFQIGIACWQTTRLTRFR